MLPYIEQSLGVDLGASHEPKIGVDPNQVKDENAYLIRPTHQLGEPPQSKHILTEDQHEPEPNLLVDQDAYDGQEPEPNLGAIMPKVGLAKGPSHSTHTALNPTSVPWIHLKMGITPP